MAEITQSKLFYTKSGTHILLVERNTVSCWNSDDDSLCFVAQGSFVGISDDENIALLLSERGAIFVDMSCGIELDKANLEGKVFQPDQRSIVLVSPNSTQLLIRDILGILPHKRIALLGKMEFHPPVRTWNSEYVVVRTWYDDGNSEGERHECYNLLNRRKAFHGPSCAGYNIQLSYSPQKNIFAIYECGRIMVYDVAAIKRIYDVFVWAHVNQGGIRTAKHPEVIDISLYPLAYNLLAVATESEIKLVTLDKTNALCPPWESAVTLERATGDDYFKNISFSCDGKYIAWVTREGKFKQKEIEIPASVVANIKSDDDHFISAASRRIGDLRETDQIDMLYPSQEGIENGIELLMFDGEDIDEQERYRLFVNKLNSYATFVYSDNFSKQFPKTSRADVVIRVVYVMPPSDAMREISAAFRQDNPAEQVNVMFQDVQSYEEMIEMAHFREQLKKIAKD